MSQENHEQRIAALEENVATLTVTLTETIRAGIADHQAAIQDRINMANLLNLILDVHPRLRTSKIAGLIHSGISQLEIKQDQMEEGIKKIKPALPPQQQPPAPPAPPGS